MPRPLKSLSQNFLNDRNILERIAGAAGVGPDDTVLEIGPGPGTLTAVLIERAARVVAVELDLRFFALLQEKYMGHPKMSLHQGDALKFPLENIEGRFKVAANIPYHITSPIIFRLLEQKDRIDAIALTIQKEVAERIAAKPGGGDYGVLSIMVQLNAEAEIMFTVPRGAFKPVPKVDSACIRIVPREKPLVELNNEAVFSELVRTAFSMRRKTIRNSMRKLSPDMDTLLEELGIDPGRRPETLSIEEFAAIANRLKG